MFKKIIVILIILLSTLSTASNNKKVKFMTDKEKEGGFLVEITRQAFARVGYDIDIQFVSWARAMDGVSKGYVEGLLGAYYTKERAKSMTYTESIGKSEMVFFKLKSKDIKYEKLEDLRGLSIGLVSGTYYTEELEEAEYFKKEKIANFELNIRKLLRNRIDLFPEKKHVVINYMLTVLPDEYHKIDYLGKPLKKVEFYNAFSKNISYTQQLVDDFNKGLNLLKEDGTYDKIIKSYPHE